MGYILIRTFDILLLFIELLFCLLFFPLDNYINLTILKLFEIFILFNSLDLGLLVSIILLVFILFTDKHFFLIIAII